MARPVVTSATCVPFQRSSSISVRWNFRGLKYLTPVLAKDVDPSHVGKTGYVKDSHTDHIAINTAIEAATDRLNQATAIIINKNNISTEAIKTEYLRLTAEATDAAETIVKAEKRKAYKKEQNRKIDSVVMLPSIIDEIAQLEQELKNKIKERDNLRKELNVYEDDSLNRFLNAYIIRDGEATMATTTRRAYKSFINVITRFDKSAKIQDIDDTWLKNFQEWLYTTESITPIYSYTPSGDKITRSKRTDIITREKKGKPRSNSTVKTYLTKMKDLLNYYTIYADKLPNGITVNPHYKRYKFKLTIAEKPVVALEENELFTLAHYNNFPSKMHNLAIDVFIFLCSTGIRYSDLNKVIPSTIKNGKIYITPNKTQKHNINIIVDINDISNKILQKYNYDLSKIKMKEHHLITRIQEVLNDTNVFPLMQTKESYSVFRGDQKELIEETRANLLGTHSGRRTFINIHLDNNKPLAKISLMTGHRNINTLMTYADKRKDLKVNPMNLFKSVTDEDQYAIPQLLEA